MEAPTYGKGQYRIPLKAQKAWALGLAPRRPCRGPHRPSKVLRGRKRKNRERRRKSIKKVRERREIINLYVLKSKVMT
jgi:hypothetical protein